MSEQDEHWFDALAGHRAPATASDARLQQALRQAVAYESASRRDELAEQRMLRRLEHEGLLPKTHRSTPRIIRPRLAQVAVIVLCVGVVLHLVRPLAPDQNVPIAARFEAAPEPKAVSQDKASLRQESPAAQSFAAPEPAPVRERWARDESASSSAPAESLQSGVMKQRKPAALADRRELEVAATASPPKPITLQVANPSAAKMRIQQLVERHADITQVKPDATDQATVQLRCDTATACDQLLQQMQALDGRFASKTLPRQQTLMLIFKEKP